MRFERTQSHSIKRQQYELVLENDSEALAYQSRVSQLQQNKISRILQKVMDTYNSPEFLDQFDEVVLDLGTISTSNFERDLEQRIEESLIKFLENNLYENGTLKTGKRKLLYTNYIEQFEFFLKKGYLKWNTSSFNEPIQIFKILFETNKKELAVLLKTLGQQEAIRLRLITQFSEDVLEQIVEAIAGMDALFMNQYRRYIVKHQDDYKWIEVGSRNYRNAIWDMTLVYVFKELTSSFNQKHFIHYLIDMIAEKYSLTYMSLRHAMVSGVQSSQIRNDLNIDFEMLMMTSLMEVDEKSKNRSDDGFNKKSLIPFIKTLRYYLKHRSFPTTSEIHSVKMLYKGIELSMTQNPKEFYLFFDQQIKDRSSIEQWITMIPKHLLNNIISRSPNKVFIKFSIFFKQIIDIAYGMHMKSSTLDYLQESIGRISLRAYNTLVTSSISDMEAFLYELLNDIEIDSEFVTVLQRFEHEKAVNRSTEISSIINEITTTQTREVLDNVTRKVTQDFLELSKKIVSYNKRSSLTLHDFLWQLQRMNCEKDTLQLVLLLLEVCSSTHHYTSKEIADWVTQRRKELIHKGLQDNVLMFQLLQVIEMLDIDQTIYEGVKKAMKETESSKDLPILLQENTADTEISSKTIDSLIELIYKQFYLRSVHRLNERIMQLIVTFSEEHDISKTLLLEQLQRHISHRNDNKIIKRILDDQQSYQSTINPTKNTVYIRDVVQYFCVHGKFPWWVKNTSLKELQAYFRQLILEFPDSFKEWFVNAKNQMTIIPWIDDAAYDALILHLNPSVNSSIINIKKLIDQLLNEKISGIRSVTSHDRNKIKYVILNHILKNPILNTITLTTHIIQNIASAFAMDVLDIKILTLETLFENKSNARDMKAIVLWLNAEVKPISKTSERMMGIEQLMDSKNNWERDIDQTKKNDVLAWLKEIYTRTPEVLFFNLKRTAFRKKLVQKLPMASHVEFIEYLIDASEQSRFLTVKTLLDEHGKQLKENEYQFVWNKFMDCILLKLAVDNPRHWSVKTWSLILYKSIISQWNTAKTIEFSSEKTNISEDRLQLMEALSKIKKNIKQDIMEEDIEEEIIGESIYIHNAGMVILGPYIPMLFERLGFLEDGIFKDDYSVQKAIHILQYMVTGKTDEGEQNLVLNKIICGIPIHKNVEHIIPITSDEKNMVESLLKAVISNWSILGNTSIEGLQETFLCRDGRLSIEEDHYILRVEEKAFDMLLDQIPWSIGKLKLSWMQKLIDVVWRK